MVNSIIYLSHNIKKKRLNNEQFWSEENGWVMRGIYQRVLLIFVLLVGITSGMESYWIEDPNKIKLTEIFVFTPGNWKIIEFLWNAEVKTQI